MVVIGVLVATGTIVEAEYDAFAAKKIIYDSWILWTALSLLVYNLTVVVADRWPWQGRHYPFITVHAGLIVLIFGGFLTYKYGTDGQLVVNINGKNNFVSSPETDLVAYATFDGDRYSKVMEREVDFFNNPPVAERPFLIELGPDKIEVQEYVKYARLQTKIKAATENTAGASIRFQLMNANVKQVEQITQPKKDRLVSFNLGPAKVHLGPTPTAPTGLNEVYLTPLDSDRVRYTLVHKDLNKFFKTGTMKIGDVVPTGWMGLELRLLDYLPKAKEEYEVMKMERPTPLTTSAVKINHKGMEKWLALNDIVKLFGTNSAYILSYQNRRLDLGFDLKLHKFEVQKYQGTQRAMEYSSEVEVIGAGENVKAVISMNEPLKFAGYTIYQASFQEDEVTGQPTASVFSVNQDPGRAVKYFGSLVFTVGIVWLFYNRRKKATSV